MYTTKEAGAFLRLAIGTLANWRVVGRGPRFMKFGSKVVYTERDLLAWADARAKTNTAQVNDPRPE